MANNTEPKANTEPKTEPKKEATTPTTDPKKDECGNEVKPEYWVTCSMTIPTAEGGAITISAEANTFIRGEEGALATCKARLKTLLAAL